MRLPIALTALTLLLAGPPLQGQSKLEIEMPLGPYWRPGKFTPVRLIAKVERGKKWVGLTSDDLTTLGPAHVAGLGAGRTSVQITDRRLDAVVPWLVMDSRARRPRFFVEHSGESILGPELRQLGEDERLVGFATGVDEALARKLVSRAEAKALAVRLHPSEPIKGHALAWELLDAIVLDSDSVRRVDDMQVSALLSCGVTIAVRSDAAPSDRWPWGREGECWVLRYSPAGPVTAGYHPAAYAPVADWRSGWPWAFRRRVLGIAAVVCIALLALALWRPPLVALWMVVAIALTSVALGLWWRGQVPIRQAGGEVVLTGGPLVQTDGWTYQTGSRDVFATLRWTEASRPIYASRGGLDDVWISLNCDTSGTPREFAAWIPAGRRVAFVSRGIGTVAPTATARDVSSPMASLVGKSLYPGAVLGQIDTAPRNNPAYGNVTMEQWGAVVVRRAAQK